MHRINVRFDCIVLYCWREQCEESRLSRDGARGGRLASGGSWVGGDVASDLTWAVFKLEAENERSAGLEE